MAHHRAVLPLLLGATLALGQATQAGARQAAPLDTLTAQALLEEASEALRKAPALRRDQRFVERLARLRESWGLDGEAARALLAPTVDPLGRLLAEGRIDEALAGVGDGRDGRPDSFTLNRLLRALVAAGREEEAVRWADSLNATSMATLLVLREGAGTAPERVARVRSLLDEGAVARFQRLQVLQQIVTSMASYDFPAAWALADSSEAAHSRLVLHLALLPHAFLEGIPQADSLLEAVIGEAEAVPDEREPARYLAPLRAVCDRFEPEPCSRIQFPPAGTGNAMLDVRGRLWNAIGEGRFDRAQDIVASAREERAHPLLTLDVLHALGRRGLHCSGDPACWRAREAWILRWTEEAARAVPCAEPAVADSLRTLASRLLAPTDAEAARQMAGEVRDPSLREEAFAWVAEALLPFDTRGAWDAVRQGGDHGQARSSAARLFPILMAGGDTAAAREALRIMDARQAMAAKLDWAERLGRAGRWSEARTWALAALDRWPPDEAVHMAHSVGQFRAFVTLGIHHELVEWARARDAPDDRAIALVSVVGNVSGLIPLPPSPDF